MDNTEIRRKIMAYVYEKNTKNTKCHVSRNELSEVLNLNDVQLDNNVLYLEEKGYLKLIKVLGSHFMMAQITAEGIDFVENPKKAEKSICATPDNSSNKTIFEKIVFWVFLFSISVFAVIDFFYATFAITYEIYLVFVLIAVLILSNSFDSLEIINVVKLRKEVSTVKKETEELKDKIFKISMSAISNSHVTNNIGGYELEKLKASDKPDNEEIEKKVKKELESKVKDSTENKEKIEKSDETPENEENNSTQLNKEVIQKLKESGISHFTILDKYLILEHISKNGFSDKDLIYEIGLKPIDSDNPLGTQANYYNGYLKTDVSGLFFRNIPYQDEKHAHLNIINQITNLLMSVYEYGKYKNMKSKLVITIFKFPNKRSKYWGDTISELKRNLLTPLSNGILELNFRELNETDIEEIEKEYNKLMRQATLPSDQSSILDFI
ncbi:hypothetical protein [Methanococcus maripaludis]|uniref:Ribosomal protein L25 (General stress protein Ctc) n=1 Tax=Methanococcus maripaludis TaxID=39152 RepID=A0A7J9PCI9_METMI|nr:hypothetical protein [Methanococcus maripaludis]MBA2860963.1 ribosomal protein L25 (general stress protein Ctc) [Methanococcus maripaludis]